MSLEFPEPYTGEGGEGFKPIPPGEYVAQAIEGSVGPPKTGNGMALTLVWSILEGEQQNRRVYQNISFIHPKPGAQWHGQRKLNAVVAAVGATLPLSTVEPLLFVPVRLGLKIQPATGFYSERNEVVSIKPYDGEAEEAQASPPSNGPAPQQAKPAAPQQAKPAAPGGKPPPWRKG